MTCQRWQRLADVVLRVSWGGDCYAYGLLALGHLDVIAEVTMKLWDWAALVPVIEGAGGKITDWSGQGYGRTATAACWRWVTRARWLQRSRGWLGRSPISLTSWPGQE